MDDSRNRDRTDTLEPEMISLEEALEQKREIRARRGDAEPGGLHAKLKAEEEADRIETLRGLTDAEKLFSRVATFFGRGPQYHYRKQLDLASDYLAQMDIVSNNLQTKITDILGRKQKSESQLIVDEAELQTNATIAVHYERRLSDATARYESAQNGSVDRLPATTEAMQSVQDITKLKQSISEVHAENNKLAVRIMTGRQLTVNLEGMHCRLQRTYADFEDQRVRAGGHLELAKVQDELLEGVSGSESVNGIYKRAGASIEQLLTTQRRFRLEGTNELPLDYRVRAPGTTNIPVAGKQFWQTLDLFTPERESH